ncbi:MAG: aldolase/citrate lyase family protein [Ignavibacteriales bacterium]|nr:aldolase/citrate lyase family protein [Ignavibacteriales bacterium]
MKITAVPPPSARRDPPSFRPRPGGDRAPGPRRTGPPVPRRPEGPVARGEHHRGRRPVPLRPHRQEGLHPRPRDRDVDRAFGHLGSLGPEQDRGRLVTRRDRGVPPSGRGPELQGLGARRPHRRPPRRRPEAHRGARRAVRLHLPRRRQELDPELLPGPPAQARDRRLFRRPRRDQPRLHEGHPRFSGIRPRPRVHGNDRRERRERRHLPQLQEEGLRLRPAAVHEASESPCLASWRKRPPMSADFRRRLLGGDRLIGTLLSLPSPELAEIAADAGFDWLFLDMEHGALEAGDVLRMVQAVREPCACLVRIPENREMWVKKALDTGAAGLIVPHINSADEAARTVHWAKYPPEGGRSVGFSRANRYGARFQENVETANAETVVVAQVEHIDGVRRHRRHSRRPGRGRRLHRPVRPLGQPGQARPDPGRGRPRGHPGRRLRLRRPEGPGRHLRRGPSRRGQSGRGRLHAGVRGHRHRSLRPGGGRDGTGDPSQVILDSPRLIY